MKNTNKRAFTIVELVIVIAVIAILAAVLIPTFSNVIKKANISKDTQLCRNMNTALAMYKSEGNKIESFSDVVNALREAGYILGNINPTTDGYYYVWNKEANRMMYVDSSFKVAHPEELLSDEPDENWYIAVSTQEDKEKLLSNSALSSINVVFAPKTYNTLLADFNSMSSVGGEVYLSTDLVVDVSSSSNRMTINAASTEDVINFNLAGSTIRSEGANGWAGGRAINVTKGTLNLSNGSIVVSSDAYGGVLVNGGTLNAENMVIENNKSGGLSVKVTAGEALVENTTINSYLGGGACIDLDLGKTGLLTLRNVTIKQTGAFADYGSCVGMGAADDNNAKITIENCTFSSENNHVFAVWNSGGTIEIKSGSFTGNDNKKMFSIDAPTYTESSVAHHADHSTIIISGGTFNGVAFSAHSANTEENIAYWKSLCANNPTVTINNGTVTISIVAL